MKGKDSVCPGSDPGCDSEAVTTTARCRGRSYPFPSAYGTWGRDRDDLAGRRSVDFFTTGWGCCAPSAGRRALSFGLSTSLRREGDHANVRPR